MLDSDQSGTPGRPAPEPAYRLTGSRRFPSSRTRRCEALFAAEADVQLSSRVLAPPRSQSSIPDRRSHMMCCWNRRGVVRQPQLSAIAAAERHSVTAWLGRRHRGRPLPRVRSRSRTRCKARSRTRRAPCARASRGRSRSSRRRKDTAALGGGACAETSTTSSAQVRAPTWGSTCRHARSSTTSAPPAAK